MDQKALTTYEIAKYCHVTPRTANQWINEGKIKAYRTVGNHSRVQINDFLSFLKRYNMPVPAELASLQQNDKKRVLIVDDDRGMVDSIRRFLIREKSYDLEIAYDGFEAGQKFSDFKPDLVILDIKMPGLNGYEVCSKIRGNPENKDVKILLISGITDQAELEQAKVSQADDYLAKPFSNAALKVKIDALLN
ncbi:MAG: response regulator [Candidatus Omnitrophica bacterium]|nr:response regulator [Candidatus Omnitrophota bacterium]MDE2213777.1 response regulator [Candidatus Omnitrophota bacterium]MDE2230647.1 response regulator [Candidatus Omnitrophota bacterium]